MNDAYVPTQRQDLADDASSRSTAYQGLPRLGQCLLDRYKVFGIKQGGLSVVFFVVDLETNRKYAAKTYRPELAGSATILERFKAEVDVWINLESHPNIVTAHFVELIAGRPYLFLEYVSTETSLRDRLAGPLGGSRAIEFAYQLSVGMEFANLKGEIAHLDLKPENLLIAEGDVLKVTDFGLAHHVRVAQGVYPRVGGGTWQYASPEQFAGGVEDTRSDIYSFGLIFYEMLAGRLPFPFRLSQDPATRFKQLSDFYARDGHRELAVHDGQIAPDSIISGCLSHLEYRFSDFTMLRSALEREFRLRASDRVGAAPGVDATLHDRALALYRIGRYSESLSLFNRLLQQQPNAGQLWLDAAQALLANGQPESARRFLQRAVELDPSLDEARRLLAH